MPRSETATFRPCGRRLPRLECVLMSTRWVVKERRQTDEPKFLDADSLDQRFADEDPAFLVAFSEFASSAMLFLIGYTISSHARAAVCVAGFGPY